LNDSDVRFGANSASGVALVGQLDDTKIFDIELSQNQVVDIFNSS